VRLLLCAIARPIAAVAIKLLAVPNKPPLLKPFMADEIKDSNNNLTTLSGMSEADSKVSVFDGGKPLATVTADSSGNWSLQANISAGSHLFTETATDLAGNTGDSTGVTVCSPSGHKLFPRRT
jgi:hypothetical protein